MPEIQKAISNVNIEFSGVTTNDKTHRSMKELIKANLGSISKVTLDVSKSNASKRVGSLIAASWEKSGITTPAPINIQHEERQKRVCVAKC
jgi:hypothetical protein